MQSEEPSLSFLERYIAEHSEQLNSIRARHRAKNGKSRALHTELMRVYQPCVDAGLIRHRASRAPSYRMSGEYIQVAYRIFIHASDGKWVNIDEGKESIKREFENFVRRILLAEHFEEILAFVDAQRKPPGEAAYSVPDLTSIWGRR